MVTYTEEIVNGKLRFCVQCMLFNVMNGRENSVSVIRRFLWGEWNGEKVAKAIEEAYKIFLWKTNLFNPSHPVHFRKLN